MAFSLIDDEDRRGAGRAGVESRVVALARDRGVGASATGRRRSGSPARPASWRWCRTRTGGSAACWSASATARPAIWAARRSLRSAAARQLPPRRAAARGPIRAGWRSAGRSAPIRSTCTARKRRSGAARLVWPKGADRGLVERLAGAICLARDLINTPASDLGPAELAEAATQVAESLGARHRVIAGDALLAENYPTIHAVGRASTRAPRLVDIIWGDESAPKVTLVGKGVCFDTGGLDLKTGLRHEDDEKGHGRRRDHARSGAGDHGGAAAGAAARAVAAGRERGLGQRDAAARHRADAQGSDRRDRQYRCRGPADPVRRAGRGLRPKSRRC